MKAKQSFIEQARTGMAQAEANMRADAINTGMSGELYDKRRRQSLRIAMACFGLLAIATIGCVVFLDPVATQATSRERLSHTTLDEIDVYEGMYNVPDCYQAKRELASAIADGYHDVGANADYWEKKSYALCN